jgi:protein-S-isoprenylcysteine O-methyltransferase Ste14
MRPFVVSCALYGAWVLSWGVAAIWSRRTAARTPRGARVLDLGLTIGGAALLTYGARLREFAGSDWDFPLAVEWLLTGLVALGLAFTWWARLTLGDLWSGSVVRKEAHVVVRRGPYRVVRHPIYTGLIFAQLVLAVQIGRPAALVGALLMSIGFWVKARLEERFLSVELGEAYADFRSMTPMLVPFWPVRR